MSSAGSRKLIDLARCSVHMMSPGCLPGCAAEQCAAQTVTPSGPRRLGSTARTVPGILPGVEQAVFERLPHEMSIVPRTQLRLYGVVVVTNGFTAYVQQPRDVCGVHPGGQQTKDFGGARPELIERIGGPGQAIGSQHPGNILAQK